MNYLSPLQELLIDDQYVHEIVADAELKSGKCLCNWALKSKITGKDKTKVFLGEKKSIQSIYLSTSNLYLFNDNLINQRFTSLSLIRNRTHVPLSI